MHEAFDVFEGLFTVLVVLGSLALAAWGASRVAVALRAGGREDAAESILRERFARGELAAQEYEVCLKTLRETRQPETPPQRGYEDYVREALGRLKPGRGTDV
jgi:hypothetical protein